MAALTLTNQSSDAAGKLPPSTCKQQGSNMVTCVAPAPGINEVEFHTYPNLTALYNAYVGEVIAHGSSGQFKQNYNDCELEQTVGNVRMRLEHPGSDQAVPGGGIPGRDGRRSQRAQHPYQPGQALDTDQPAASPDPRAQLRQDHPHRLSNGCHICCRPSAG